MGKIIIGILIIILASLPITCMTLITDSYDVPINFYVR